jgi:hypothetical protein
VVLTDDLSERLGPVAAVERKGCFHACTLASGGDNHHETAMATSSAVRPVGQGPGSGRPTEPVRRLG